MGDFKRSPSKVWWASDSVQWREVSKSPGSQDSGFSDTETSPNHQIKSKSQKSNNQPNQITSVDIYKQSICNEKPQNISSNYKEKTTPDKNITSQLCSSQPESPKSSRYTKNSPKVSRSLFKIRHKDSTCDHNQYSKCVIQETTHSISSEPVDDSYSVVTVATLPNINNTKEFNYFLNHSAPAVLQEIKDEEDFSITGNNSLSSDCESELECLFNGPLDSPQHTSTPKASYRYSMQRKRKPPLNLYLKYQQERGFPVVAPEPISNEAVHQWMNEAKQHYEQECMTTLQAKSIFAELNQKISKIALYSTASVQDILTQAKCIESEYKNLNSEKKHISALAQSLAGNIMSYLKPHAKIESKITRLYDDIRKSQAGECLRQTLDLFNYWQLIHQDVLLNEVKSLIVKLEHPSSELDLRATVTGITSISLQYEDIVDLFTKNDIIPILVTLCEKCEGSSLRSLLLRALTIMCSNAFSVREFEKFSGIQILSDTLKEDSRPEPERSEAVALLAQITAPWIEDNHCIRGLQNYTRIFVKSLTKFAEKTKCCQNLLLCAAALANLSTMDNKCIKYMLHVKTSEILLQAINRRGSCASVYLLEQVATLIANISSSQSARKQLSEIKAPKALLCFLKTRCVGGDVEKRLQQKTIIALSRLCSDREAATQVVEAGGVEKLVKMCKEKEERFDNDAVLVATLATLRKISDACGRSVISAEDAQELVEPKLLDSFLAYSAQSESYV